jgi:tRNA(fMet)-specific endonuclease VapC
VKYLLDSNILIHLLRGRHLGSILDGIKRHAEDGVLVCSVVRFELITGARKSQQPDRNLALVEELLGDFDSLPFDDRSANEAGRLRAALEAVGTPIGPNDILIASIALAHGLTLVTADAAEFARVEGLVIENWATA